MQVSAQLTSLWRVTESFSDDRPVQKKICWFDFSTFRYVGICQIINVYYIRNNRGPRIEPWVRPAGLDQTDSLYYHTLLPASQVANHPRNNVRIQILLLQFWKKRQMLNPIKCFISKLKSKNTALTLWPLSVAKLSVAERNVDMVDLPFWKPHCMFDGEECSVKWSMINMWKCFSSNLLRIDV